MSNFSTLDLLIPSSTNIQEAEKYRKTGQYAQAYVLVQGVLFIETPMLANLDEMQKCRFLSALRICFGSMFSITKLEVNPISLKSGLVKTRKILSIYESQTVQSIALNTKIGILGESYDFQGEMSRDIARYLSFLVDLRGFGTLSLSTKLDDLSKKASEDTLRTLMIFEGAAVTYSYNGSTRHLGQLADAARNAVKASMKAKNYERAATVAARFYTFAQFGVFAEFAKKWFDDAVSQDPSVSSIWDRENKKSQMKLLAQHIRRIVFRLWPLDWDALSVSIN